MSESPRQRRIRGLHGLMERYVDGDPRAFSRMHEALEPRLRGFLMKLVRDGAAVDDLIQLTMLKAHLARDRFRLQGGDPDGAVQGWYFAIARNVAMDHLRDRHRQQRREQAPRGEDRADPVSEVASSDPSMEEVQVTTEEEREVVDRVREAISLLPPGQRDVVEMHKLKGMTMAQVAARLRVREGAVRVRAHRAYRALARILGGREDDA